MDRLLLMNSCVFFFFHNCFIRYVHREFYLHRRRTVFILLHANVNPSSDFFFFLTRRNTAVSLKNKYARGALSPTFCASRFCKLYPVHPWADTAVSSPDQSNACFSSPNLNPCARVWVGALWHGKNRRKTGPTSTYSFHSTVTRLRG